MLIKQLSIFLENKKGRFTEVAKILGEAGVNMSAFTVAENSDFGILRLIVSDTEKAISVLREKLYAVSVADVVCLHCPNQPGALAKAMDIITSAGIQKVRFTPRYPLPSPAGETSFYPASAIKGAKPRPLSLS